MARRSAAYRRRDRGSRDAAATLPPHASELVIDNLELVARFTAKPTGDTRTFRVATSGPVRGYAIDLAPEARVDISMR